MTDDFELDQILASLEAKDDDDRYMTALLDMPDFTFGERPIVDDQRLTAILESL